MCEVVKVVGNLVQKTLETARDYKRKFMAAHLSELTHKLADG
jgi:hypothetical protein